MLFLVFVIGSAGSAIFGGPFEGRDGLGKAVVSAIVSLVWESDGRSLKFWWQQTQGFMERRISCFRMFARD